MDELNCSGGLLNLNTNQIQTIKNTEASKHIETNLINLPRKVNINDSNLNTSTWVPINNNLLKIPDEKEVRNKMNIAPVATKSLFNINRRKTKSHTDKVPIFQKLSKNKVDPEMVKIVKSREKIAMNYNVCQILVKTFCCCFQGKRDKMKQRLFERGYKKFSYDMDILTYIRKMHEIDILKYLLFNNQQTSLFNFVSKPSVSLISKNELIDSLPEKFDVKFNKNEIDLLHKYFHEMIVSNYQSKFDKKLLKLVASEIDNLTMGI
jgi:hypothetical protein